MELDKFYSLVIRCPFSNFAYVENNRAFIFGSAKRRPRSSL